MKKHHRVLLCLWHSASSGRANNTLSKRSMMGKWTRNNLKVLDLNYLEVKRSFSKTLVNGSIEKLIESLPIESHKWFNTRTIVNAEQLKGRPTIFLNVDDFSSDVFLKIMNSEIVLESRVNILGFDHEQNIDLLRSKILYHDFQYPVFIISEECKSIVQLYNEKGEFMREYSNHEQFKHNFEKDFDSIQIKNRLIQMVNFDWQKYEKPIERLMQPQTIFQFPTFIEKYGNSIFISDTYHNRIVQMNHEGGIEAVFGEGRKGFKDGYLVDARFNRPKGIFYDKLQEALLIADTNNNTIRRLDLHNGFVSTFIQPSTYSMEEPHCHNPLMTCGENSVAAFLHRDDNTKMMLTEEYIEKKFIMEREKEWKKNHSMPIPIYFVSCSKIISRPIDLFMSHSENCLYIAEEGYTHIWRIPLDTGIVEDVLPEMIHSQLKHDFEKYIEHVFPTLKHWDSEQRQPYTGSFYPEFLFLKQRAIAHQDSIFFYHVESPISAFKPYHEPFFMKQVKIVPNRQVEHSVFNDHTIASVQSSTLYRSSDIGFRNALLSDENKPTFNNPHSILKLDTNLIISDTFNHKLRKISVVNGQSEDIKPKNLNLLGIPSVERRVSIRSNGSVDINPNPGRIIVTEAVTFMPGSCLLTVRFSSSEHFVFAEKLHSNMIDIIFKNHDGEIVTNAISYIHHPEKFEQDAFIVNEDNDWKSIRRKNRAYDSVPFLVSTFENHQMEINIPFELPKDMGDVEMDVNVVLYLTPESTNRDPIDYKHPFTLHHGLDTISYAPFNLQTTFVKGWNQHHDVLEEMDKSERLKLRNDLAEILEWKVQESFNSILKENLLEISNDVKEKQPPQNVESMDCNDKSQIFIDYLTLRVPIQVSQETTLNSSKKEKFLKHHFSVDVSASPPLFTKNCNKHQYIATSNNV
ncbi:hypothetical protein C9374_013335 [Naegleria lovaniensis]|uniref:Uncharacterized protein n=1 Tax=Naegleria lovaniensis TaxID=51637 RepID=A0AA88GVQ8_NAELO|nr:uncharacterized protein C9374_013335 [Naegleria lovaniensis]KAG2391850.1 hypothetical protein C9374_013335 [Naegleria lovaniensis]